MRNSWADAGTDKEKLDPKVVLSTLNIKLQQRFSVISAQVLFSQFIKGPSQKDLKLLKTERV